MFSRTLEEEPVRSWAKMPRMAKADLRRLERVARKRAAVNEEFRQAVLIAVASGETYADVGRAAGISPQRVGQIVEEARRR